MKIWIIEGWIREVLLYISSTSSESVLQRGNAKLV